MCDLIAVCGTVISFQRLHAACKNLQKCNTQFIFPACQNFGDNRLCTVDSNVMTVNIIELRVTGIVDIWQLYNSSSRVLQFNMHDYKLYLLNESYNYYKI